MTAKPWYDKGLQFTCTGCGNCCTGEPGYVWVTPEEAAEIGLYLGKGVDQMCESDLRQVGRRLSLTERDNGDCTFLDPDTRKCTVYPVRPTQCRTWPFWPSNLQSPEVWEEVKRICPGSGKGEWVSVEEIQRRASLIDA